MTIYLVTGRTKYMGWIIASYTTLEMAELHLKLLKEDFLSIMSWLPHGDVSSSVYDPTHSIHAWSETKYEIEPIQHYLHLDQFLEDNPIQTHP